MVFQLQWACLVAWRNHQLSLELVPSSHALWPATLDRTALITAAAHDHQAEALMWRQAAQQANTAGGDLRMEDFPAAGQAPGAAQGSAQAGSGRWAGAISAAGGQGGLRAEDFPALPGKGYSQAMTVLQGVAYWGTLPASAVWSEASCLTALCWQVAGLSDAEPLCIACRGPQIDA